ncbi:hypothetical protein [Parapedobacter sp. 2B3]|uniref:hypothetical protein n=1 Tax=Parapedobacter sp. 2B3 TaxID=3342381 RepID=UPI0035B5B573
MIKRIRIYHLLAIVALIGFMACEKDRIDLDGQCIEATGLAFREYCENTFLIQLPAKYGDVGETIHVDNQTYHRVVKIAGGNLTLYDGFMTGDRIFVELRTYDPEADHELIAYPYACLALFGPQFPEVPIFVATAISGARCP